MTWEEITRTPVPVLQRRLQALTRARARARANHLEDQAMVNEINTGQVVVGNVPASNLGYSIKNTPYDRHIWAQRRISLGLPVGELPDERQARIREENRRLDALLLN